MSRRKQLLTAVKDLSPLPDLSPAAKRARRYAADRSREKVRSYVRLLQRDGGAEVEHQKEEATACGVKRNSKSEHSNIKRSHGPRMKRSRSSSPTQLVTITIRDDEPSSTLNTVPQEETCARRSGRQYTVVDYSRLHFGAISEPKEEEEPEEGTHWQNPLGSLPHRGHASRRGRPPKVASTDDQSPRLNRQQDRQSEEGSGIFVCRRCNLGHDSVDEFLKHFETAHCPELTDEEFHQRLHNNSYTCGRCEFYTVSKDELERHEGLHHNRQRNPLVTKWRGRYHCDLCDFSATNSVTLSHHRKIHQKQLSPANKLTKSGDGIAFACAECMARFADRQDVLRHQEQVHNRVVIH